MTAVATLSGIVDRKVLGPGNRHKRQGALRPAEKMNIIDSVRNGELLVSRDVNHVVAESN